MMRYRPAREDELPWLRAQLQKRAGEGYEQVDLTKAIVYIVEEDGLVAGMACARLIWQIEPLVLFKDFERVAPLAAVKRATYLLGKAVTDFLGDRTRNLTGLHWFFCCIDDKRFRYLARRFGLVRIYRRGQFFCGGN